MKVNPELKKLKEDDMKFVRRFMSINVSNICHKLGIDKSNFFNKKVSPEKTHKVKEELNKQIMLLYVNDRYRILCRQREGVKMAKQIVHYDLDPLDSLGADINLIMGERSGGKSYQLKHKKAVEKFFKLGKRFILLRRFREEINAMFIEQYFADVDIKKITDGKSNCIILYRKAIYCAYYDEETGKTTKHEKIRLCCQLINRIYVCRWFLFRRRGYYL